MKPIRVCLVGAGAWGLNLLRNARTNAGLQVTGVCDPDAASRAQAEVQCPQARFLERFDQVLDDALAEAIIIASPPQLHFAQARAALQAGLHVLVEKPMCLNSVDAGRLAEISRRSGQTLMVGHTFLYSNVVHEVKRRIDSGELGRVLCVYSQRLNLGRVRADVDAMWNFAPHDVSILGYLLNRWPTTVTAQGACFLQPAQKIADVAFFQLQYACGALAAGHVSWLDPQKVRRMVIVGSEKMLVYDDVNVTRPIEIYDKSVAVQFRANTHDFCEFTTRVRAGDVVIPHVRMVEPLSAELDHFVECIRSGMTPRSDVRNGQHVVAVLEALSQSISQGGSPQSVCYSAAMPSLSAAPHAAALQRDFTSV